ncbi:MAG: histidine phosphatase family protein [Candidatus Altarchaeaceae archaeon]
MIRIVLIRHCETNWNKEKRYLGKTDIPLNEKGIRDAEILGKFLMDKNFEEIYSSELSRAYNTAKIIAEFNKFNNSVKKIKEFNEIDFGDFEGLTFEEVKEKFGEEIVNKYLNDTLNFKFPNGESFRKLYRRTTKGLNFILDKHEHDNDCNILIVSHSGVNRIIIGNALKISFKKSIWRIKQDIGCVNVIDFFKNFAVVELINGKFI